MSSLTVKPADWPIPRVPFAHCPLCGALPDKTPIKVADCSAHPSYAPIIDKTMRWLGCDVCGHVYTEGYFDPRVLQQLFSRVRLEQRVGHDFERKRPIAARIIERVQRHGPGGVWMDVGFGDGALLMTAVEFGYQGVGVEPHAENVRQLTALGIVGYDASLADFGTEDFKWLPVCDVVSLADVLEHVPDPRAALKCVHRQLREEGILFVSLPHYGCPAWLMLDALNVNPYWAELEHFHNFSRAGLYALLRETGFEPLHYAVSERYRVCMEIIAKKV